ncbi:hypothetical protein [Burkholderia ambifaria]|uniref:hypothetical protein n=1 Tax=Burkholderia ambifaria TaxID=152480 RepID=UPI00158F025C|nr:hypothetical protein [Burkholderia ambifaria]
MKIRTHPLEVEVARYLKLDESPGLNAAHAIVEFLYMEKGVKVDVARLRMRVVRRRDRDVDLSQ